MMNFTLLVAAPASIQLHIITAVCALVLGTVILLMKKGTRIHKTIGRVWCLAMYVTAISSFAVTSLFPGHLSPIHILSLVTLVTLPLGLLARRQGNILHHARIMQGNFIGLLVAGVFTLVPGRLLGQVIFGW
jgi:uncharacterized membrane protein